MGFLGNRGASMCRGPDAVVALSGQLQELGEAVEGLEIEEAQVVGLGCDRPNIFR